MFLDRVKLKLSAGNGGNGCVAWRREKFIPKGGPSGGNGGRGGSLYLQGDRTLYSLEKFRNLTSINAQHGVAGASGLKNGKQGEDLIIHIPCGTIIRDANTGALLCEITDHEQRFLLCRGGKGGIGNNFFKSPTRRAPDFATPGKEGESVDVELELKLIADIGLIGMPNAGKSTLLSRLSKAHYKIGNYPFTTLYPNIGSIQFDDFSKLIIADVPGIIKDAHLNKGLGMEFLKHIERCQALVYIVDASGEEGRDPLDDLHILQEELRCYSELLANKPHVIALNKADKPESTDHIATLKKKLKDQHVKVISGETGEGVAALLEEMRHLGQINGKRFY